MLIKGRFSPCHTGAPSFFDRLAEGRELAVGADPQTCAATWSWRFEVGSRRLRRYAETR